MPGMTESVNTRRKLLNNSFKRIFNRRRITVSTRPELIQADLLSLVQHFNEYYNFAQFKWSSFRKEFRAKLLRRFKYDQLRLEKLKLRHNLEFNIPAEFGIKLEPFQFMSDDIVKPEEEEFFDVSLEDALQENMSATDSIKLAGTIIKPFDGSFDKLNGFITKIKLLKSMVPAEHTTQCVQFVIGNLEGKASAIVPEDTATLEEVIEILRKRIKSDPSRVVESRLTAIRFDNRNLTSFTEEIEKVADTLSKTYISEGIPHDKANEMTVSRVVDTCRQSARNDLVKSVLASSTFESPKDVLSKFVTEVAAQNKDKQFLAFKQQQTPRPYNLNNNRRRGNYSGYHNNNNQYRSDSGYSNSNNQYRGDSHNAQYNRGGNHNHFQPRGRNERQDSRTNHNVRRMAQNEESENEESARWPMNQIQDE